MLLVNGGTKQSPLHFKKHHNWCNPAHFNYIILNCKSVLMSTRKTTVSDMMKQNLMNASSAIASRACDVSITRKDDAIACLQCAALSIGINPTGFL